MPEDSVASPHPTMPVATIQLDTQYQPPVAATISTRGLALHQFIVQYEGKTHDIVVGPEQVGGFALPAHKYQNVVIGRYSNRLPVGEYPLDKDGATAKLKTQPNESPRVSLHGGPTGFDQPEWSLIELKDADPSLFSSAERKNLGDLPEGSAALFKYTSKDGDQGFPGTLEVQVLFVVVPAEATGPGPNAAQLALGSLAIVYRAKVLPGTNGSRSVTPVNLTQHWGFNLDASLLSSARQPMTDVKDHVLSMNAASTIELDKDALATGILVPVQETPEHQHNSKPIGDRFPEKGYDSFYVFHPQENYTSPLRVLASNLESLNVLTTKGVLKPFKQEGAAKPLVELSSPKSGLTTRFTSNQPGVQFYSGYFMDAEAEGSRKRIHGGNGTVGQGDGYPKYSAAFLEFHELLAAWLHPYSTSATDTLLTSDTVYNNFVRVDILTQVQQQPTGA
ncbi:galactose mutarotase-like protein [Auriculariales sp. MPI-PUGE-AT-0066]|nr:galactose mutarotase-like protein [Auriculariales sp. MPI-PUGE-AT-0066]